MLRAVMRYVLISLFAMAVHALPAQLVLMDGTVLEVDPGTSLRIGDGILFDLEATASLINNGVIGFQPTASLQEQPGNPITGAGVETTTNTYGSPLSAVDPAGLGLQMTTSLAPGMLTLTRGHLPFTDNGGMQSVARWYDVDADVNSSLNATLSFRYDLTELNGVDELDQTLHIRAPGNYWNSFTSVVDQPDHEVTATGIDSLGLFTLYDGISTGMASIPVAGEDLIVLMEAGFESILVITPYSSIAGRLAILDAHGKLIASVQQRSGYTRIPVQALSSGLYLVRADGNHTRTFVIP